MNQTRLHAWLGGVLVTLALGGAAPSRAAATAPTPRRDASRKLLASKPTKVRQAYEALRRADCFEDAYVGQDGHLSHFAEAFRVLHAQPEAAALFRALSQEGTTAGKLYALSGTYFADPARFPSEMKRLMQLDGGQEICVRRGCTPLREPVAKVVRSPNPERILIARGQTVKEAMDELTRTGRKSFIDDIAGGYTPLSFLDGDPKAPRDPL
jgi:hypothetical protein